MNLVVDIEEIDAATAEDFWMAVAPCLPRQAGERLTVDLRDVRFMASAGIGVLLKANAHARRCGGSIQVINAQSPVARVLDVTGVLALFDGAVEATVDPDALVEVGPAAGPAIELRRRVR